MFRSMTAYVYKSVATSIGQLTIELQTLNRKYLEISTFLQRELSRYESDFKKMVGDHVKRGQVNVRVSLKCDTVSPLKVTPNISLAKQIKEAWVNIANELEIPQEEFSLDLLKGEVGVLNYEESLGDDEAVKLEVLGALQLAIKELIVLKELEGQALAEDVNARIELIADWIEKIYEKSDGATDRYREKLRERIEEVLSGSVENEERILREVCLFSERVDIAEEITRFRSHIALFRKMVDSDEFALGKKLEFVLQELLREVNTIGSKSSDVAISHIVVDIKSELEKIKEQIQNIE